MSRRKILFLALIIVTLATVVAGVSVGPVGITALQTIKSLAVMFGVSSPEGVQEQHLLIVSQIRFPRVLASMVIGGVLAQCGAVMQGMFRNPLADPGLIGVTAGSGLLASAMIVLRETYFKSVSDLLQPYDVMVASCIGAFLTTMIVYRVARSNGRTNITIFILAGIAVGTIAGAAGGILGYIATETQLRELQFWGMGSFGRVKWDVLWIAMPPLIGSLIGCWYFRNALNVMVLGDSEAKYLGMNVERMRLIFIVLVSLGVGVSVSVAGGIAFVGLVVPHAIRLLIGPDHRFLLPASLLLGGVLVTGADMVSRTAFAPLELPIGILLTIIGGPLFLLLVVKQRRSMYGDL